MNKFIELLKSYFCKISAIFCKCGCKVEVEKEIEDPNCEVDPDFDDPWSPEAIAEANCKPKLKSRKKKKIVRRKKG